MIHFLGCKLSDAMLELSIEVSLNLFLIEACTCVLRNILSLLLLVVARLMFTKFAHVILMHWHVISITCKITCELLMSNT